MSIFKTKINYILRHIREARQGGSEMVVRKLKQVGYLLGSPFFFILALPIVLIIKLIRPFIYIRFLELEARRLGHFAGNTEIYLCEIEKGMGVPPGRYVDICYLQQPVCNKQLAKMWGRKMIILPFFVIRPVDKLFVLFFGECKYKIQSVVSWSNLLESSPIHLQFTKTEELRGFAYLEQMGVNKNSEFICLNVRDSAFLKHFLPGSNFDRHNFRKSEISNYILAAEELANRGYYVIRMGAKVEKPLISKNPKIIDYAWNGMRNDFMDVFLAAKCKFCISTSTGWDSLPLIFRRPIVLVNYPLIRPLSSIQIDQLVIPKHYVSIETKKKLSFSEILLHKDMSVSEDLQSAGIEVHENSPEEICEIVLELDDRLKQSWIADEKDDFFQEQFWNILFSDKRINHKLYKRNDSKGRIGAKFLRKNKLWIE